MKESFTVEVTLILEDSGHTVYCNITRIADIGIADVDYRISKYAAFCDFPRVEKTRKYIGLG